MAGAPETDRIDVNALIDKAKFGMRQITVTAVCLLAMLMEGYDTYSVSYVGPEISKLWGIPSGELGVLLSAVLVGASLGYLVGGMLADRLGRRLLIIYGTLAFGVITLLSTLAGGSDSFIVWRFLTGLALGIALPNIVALSAEYAPARHRAISVVVLYAGSGVGATIGGFVSARLVPIFDWKIVFYVGGVLPLLLAAVMLKTLPESVRFLALKNGSDGRIRALLSRITDVSRLSPTATFFLKGEQLAKRPMAELFKGGRATATLLVWLTLTMDGGVLVIIAFWLPSLLVDAGQTQIIAIEITTFIAAGGTFGAPIIGFLMDRFGPYRVLIPAHFAALILIVTIVSTLDSPSFLLALAYGVAINGGISGLHGLIASIYPTSIRGTGVGWAVAIGRVTGIAAPILIGFLRDAGFAPTTNLYGCGLLIAIAMGSLFFLSRNPFGRPHRAD